MGVMPIVFAPETETLPVGIANLSAPLPLRSKLSEPLFSVSAAPGDVRLNVPSWPSTMLNAPPAAATPSESVTPVEREPLLAGAAAKVPVPLTAIDVLPIEPPEAKRRVPPVTEIAVLAESEPLVPFPTVKVPPVTVVGPA